MWRTSISLLYNWNDMSRPWLICICIFILIGEFLHTLLNKNNNCPIHFLYTFRYFGLSNVVPYFPFRAHILSVVCLIVVHELLVKLETPLECLFCKIQIGAHRKVCYTLYVNVLLNVTFAGGKKNACVNNPSSYTNEYILLKVKRKKSYLIIKSVSLLQIVTSIGGNSVVLLEWCRTTDL